MKPLTTPARQEACVVLAVFTGIFAVALLATGHAPEALGALVLVFLSLTIAYFDISKLGIEAAGLKGSFETRAIEKPTADAQRVLGDLVETVHHIGAASFSGEGTLTAIGVAGPARTITDDAGSTDNVHVDLQRDIRPQLERVLAFGIETGFIAAKQGWQTVPRPVVTWPTEDGDPVISYMVGNDTSASHSGGGHIELGGNVAQPPPSGTTGHIELGGTP